LPGYVRLYVSTPEAYVKDTEPTSCVTVTPKEVMSRQAEQYCGTAPPRYVPKVLRCGFVAVKVSMHTP